LARLRGNRRLIKEINRNLVLNLIKSRGPISRTEIAKLSGLSLATISGITAELIEKGLVHETGAGESTGGRRPVLLRLNPEAGFVVGLKLMEQAIAGAVTDLDASVLHHRVISLTTSPAFESVLQMLIKAVETLVSESGIDRSRMLGIGIGMAGVIDGEAGICRYSPFFGWRNVNMAEPLEAHFGLPVYIDNDVNTLTIAEQWFGYGHGVDHFVVVTVGRGIGAGIVVNGRFYRGALGGAGELGHITIIEDGPLCDCGKRGCLEALAADPAVQRMVEEAKGRKFSLEEIVEMAEQGDEVAQEALARSGRYLGIGIATLVNILNPRLIIVGGEGVRAGKWRLEPMREALRKHAFDDLLDNLEIVIEPAGDETWARGAASLVLEKIFQPPIHRQQEISPLAVLP